MINVIGAGVSGLVFAAMAHRRQMEVSVHECGEADLSNSCAWKSGGMLAPWCEGETAEQIVCKLGERSMQLWPEHTSFMETRGTLILAPRRDSTSLQNFASRTVGWQLIDHAGIKEIEPELSDRYSEGLYFANEGHLHPRETMTEIKHQLTKAGVSFSFGNKYERSGDCDQWTVDCSGMGAKELLPSLRGVKGEMMLIRSKDVTLNRPVRLIHPRHPIYIVPRSDHTFMVGATTIENEAETGISVRSAGELLTQVYNLHPAFGEAEILEFNSGLRPAFPDNLPCITVRGRLILINGLYRHGFLLAPALAELALNYMENGKAESEVFNVD